MKTLKFATLLVVATLVLAAGFGWTSPALAKTPDRQDNKVLVSGVPQGFAIQVAQPDSSFPRGPGNLPDSAGVVTAYAPLDRLSQVYLWDKATNAYYLIATISPTSTWPDTTLSVPLQYAQAFQNRGLAAPIQVNPGYTVPSIPSIPYYSVPAVPGDSVQPPSVARPGQYVVQPGDTLGAIARAYGTTVGALAAINGIPNPNLIHPGQVLTLPGLGQ